jgi:hypothetical protein
MQVGEYVQFGSGFSAPEGWLNFDISPTLRFERLPLIGKLCTCNMQRFRRNVLYGDIVKGLPIPDGSCRGIYCSHVLERDAEDKEFNNVEDAGRFEACLAMQCRK